MDLRADLRRIAAPTLVVAGEQDGSTPPEHGERIAAAIAGARLEILSPAAHIAAVERADEVTAADRRAPVVCEAGAMSPGTRSRLLAVARGDAEPDLVVGGARVFSAFTREWLDGDVAVADGRIAGVGRYDGGERIEAAGRPSCPG